MKVGDRVKIIDNSVFKVLEIGELGTIVCLNSDKSYYPYDVQLDRDPPNDPTPMLELEIGLVE